MDNQSSVACSSKLPVAGSVVQSSSSGCAQGACQSAAAQRATAAHQALALAAPVDRPRLGCRLRPKSPEHDAVGPAAAPHRWVRPSVPASTPTQQPCLVPASPRICPADPWLPAGACPATRTSRPLLQPAAAAPAGLRRRGRVVVRADGQAVNVAAVEEKSAAHTLKRERQRSGGRLGLRLDDAVACLLQPRWLPAPPALRLCEARCRVCKPPSAAPAFWSAVCSGAGDLPGDRVWARHRRSHCSGSG